jgi:DNA-binding CsgD family transcriptional regulator
MDRAAYDSLTPMERNCLRLAHHERKTEHIAHELGIAPSTVNTHIFAARRKLGGISRLSAADQLRRYEDAATSGPGLRTVAAKGSITVPPQPFEAPPAAPQPQSRPSMSMAEMPIAAAHPETPTEVREERAAFVFDVVARPPGGQDHADTPFRRVVMVLAIALLAALVLIAAPAIYDSAAQRVANSLERPHEK